MTVGVSQFPTALDTPVTLIEVANDPGTVLLAAPLATGDAFAQVNSTTGYPNTGAVSIGDEVLYYAAKTSTQFGTAGSPLLHGQDGTAAVAHGLNSEVDLRVTAGAHTVLVTALIATQTKLGYGGLTAPPSPAANTAIVLKALTGGGQSDWVALTAAEVGTALGYTAMRGSNNLSEVSSAATARSNIGAGTVSSVGLTAGGSIFSVTGSPVTGSGTLALALMSQTANAVLIGPSSGGGAAPTFRALAAADLPGTLASSSMPQLTLTATTGTAPLVISSTTLVSNLNAELLGGQSLTNLDARYLLIATRAANLFYAGPSSGAAANPTFRAIVANDLPGTLNSSTMTQLTLAATTGTAPLVVSSTTLVSNLNAERIGGQTLAGLDARYQAPLGYTPLSAAANLSDLASAATARTNLGLGTMATQAASSYVPLTGATMTGQLILNGSGSAGNASLRVIGVQNATARLMEVLDYDGTSLMYVTSGPPNTNYAVAMRRQVWGNGFVSLTRYALDDGSTKRFVIEQTDSPLDWYDLAAGSVALYTAGTTQGDIALLTDTGGNLNLFVFSHLGRFGVGMESPGEAIDAIGNIRASGQLKSTIADGTAPLVVTSTTLVTNLNAERVGGQSLTNLDSRYLLIATRAANLFYAGPSSGGAVNPTFRAIVANDLPSTLNSSTMTQLTLGATTGTAPLVVSSTTVVTNLNAERVGGQTLTNLDARYQASLGYTPENVSNKDTDGTFASNSDTKYASQKATRTAIGQRAILTGSAFATTSTSLVDITGLSVPVAANTTYEVEIFLSANTTSDTSGIQFAIQFSSTGATVEAQLIGTFNGTAVRTDRLNAFNTASGNRYLQAASQDGMILIKGTVTVGSNAGNLTAQCSKSTSGTATIRPGSFIKALPKLA